MRQPAAFGVASGLLCLATATMVAAANPAGFAGPGVAPRSAEIMLYLSHSIGGPGGSAATGLGHPTFGLRVAQVRLNSGAGNPDAGDGISRRELVNWQMQAHSDVQIEFGRKVTYNVTRGSFAGLGLRPASTSGAGVGLGQPQPGKLSASTLQSRIFAPRLAEPAAMVREPRDTYRESSTMREIAAAAIATFKSAHIASSQHGLPVTPRGQVMRASYRGREY